MTAGAVAPGRRGADAKRGVGRSRKKKRTHEIEVGQQLMKLLSMLLWSVLSGCQLMHKRSHSLTRTLSLSRSRLHSNVPVYSFGAKSSLYSNSKKWHRAEFLSGEFVCQLHRALASWTTAAAAAAAAAVPWPHSLASRLTPHASATAAAPRPTVLWCPPVSCVLLHMQILISVAFFDVHTTDILHFRPATHTKLSLTFSLAKFASFFNIFVT